MRRNEYIFHGGVLASGSLQTNNVPRIVGYQGNQSITVKVHGVDKDQNVLEKILDGAVNNGANEVNGVYLSIEKPTDLQNNARKLAIEDAKKKVKELADASGLKVGKIVSVSESSGGYYPYAYESSMMNAAPSAKSVAPDIQTGSQEISETMTVEFELK